MVFLYRVCIVCVNDSDGNYNRPEMIYHLNPGRWTNLLPVMRMVSNSAITISRKM